MLTETRHTYLKMNIIILFLFVIQKYREINICFNSFGKNIVMQIKKIVNRLKKS